MNYYGQFGNVYDNDDMPKKHTRIAWKMSIMIRGERIVFSGPNTNMNIIRVHKFDRIRIRILFVFVIMTEYEYEYYSGSEI